MKMLTRFFVTCLTIAVMAVNGCAPSSTPIAIPQMPAPTPAPPTATVVPPTLTVAPPTPTQLPPTPVLQARTLQVTSTAAGSPIHGVFEGITPCSRLTRPLPQIPADTNCEQMIWKFTLYQDPATGTPTTYTLNSAYGVPQQGTPGLVGGGTAIVMEGSWAIVKGTKLDPDALVYQLYSDNSQTAVSFLRMSEDLLHVLNSDQTLMVGNAAWSYTLNRTDNRIPLQVNEQPDSAPEASTRPPIPPRPPGSSVLGVFEGRLPCHEIVSEFTKIAPYPGCAKIKWRLTLYQDQTTGTPSTYLYHGTRTIREGTWTMVRGTRSDPDAVVYRLQLDNSQQPVSFLKADENHLYLLDRALNFLVGDALFSYTLSRTDTGAQGK